MWFWSGFLGLLGGLGHLLGCSRLPQTRTPELSRGPRTSLSVRWTREFSDSTVTKMSSLEILKVEDKDTGELHRPHHLDLKTGMYRGKQILKVKERI